VRLLSINITPEAPFCREGGATGPVVHTVLLLRISWPTLALALAGCSSHPSGTLQLVSTEGAATFDGVTTWSVQWVDSSDVSHPLASVPATASTIDLGSLDENSIGMIEVSGLDGNGHTLVFGSTIPIQFGAVDGLTIQLFVQRTGALAALPGPLTDGREAPVLALIGGRYLFVGGGTDAMLALTTQLYDFASLSPLPSPPTLALAARSVAFVGTAGWIVGPAGTPPVTAASEFDFASGTPTAVTAPSGAPFTFDDVAGGVTVSATDGSGAQFIVGGTRTTGTAATAATTAVLEIDSSGTLSWLVTRYPRWGAAATWVDAVGLVVAGGSASAPGVEILDPTMQTNSRPLDGYPSDPSVSSGATTLDDVRTVLLAGGVLPDGSDAGVRTVDLSCQGTCAAVPWSALPEPLTATQAFAIAPLTAGGISRGATVVGTDGSGTTHVFVVTSADATERPTSIAHRNARAVPSPVGPRGSILLFGGADAVESFVPVLL
jgi:hypothetical protein